MPHPPDYRGRRVVVTGCASGIGRATAALLMELGAQVHGLDRTPNDLSLHAFTPIDLRNPATIAAAVASIGAPVHGLFNCAGLPPGPVTLDVLKVNFIGTRHLTELVVPLMPAGGAIANVASNGGADWPAHLPLLQTLVETNGFEQTVQWCQRHAAAIPNAYSVSKQALIVWTMVNSAILIKRGLRMNCTSPGAVQTPMLEEIEKMVPAAAIDVMAQPIGRRSTPEEQAAPLVFLNSPAAAYINGVLLPVDGGFMAARAVSPQPPQSLGRR